MPKAALVQMRASTDKAKNLEQIIQYISQASQKGAALVALPEFMMFYTTSQQTPAQLAKQAEPISGPFVSAVAQAARQNAIDTVGTFYEQAPGQRRVYDTAFYADSRGKIISVYRKAHLYDAYGIRESAKLAAGSQAPKTHKSQIGPLGMLVCYDLRFPEMARMLAASGSYTIVAPSAWVRGPNKEDQWVTINRARAIENGCYMVCPDQTGNIYCGRSLIVDPTGKVLLDMKKRQGIGTAEISPQYLRQVRASMPLLSSRRTDIYGDLGRPRRA